jgi:transcriptional regulator with XRE-family HTH domain
VEKETNTKSFSVRLVRARVARGWSQTELSHQLGFSLRSVQNWESGDFLPQGKTLRKLSETLERSIPFLLGEDQPGTLSEFAATYSESSVRTKCHQYLNQMLDECGTDEGKLWWTFHELKRTFPLSGKSAIN